MKIIKYILASLLFIGFISCEDKLDTSPAVNQPVDVIFKTVENGFVSLNGIYRSMYRTTWATDYKTENFGQASVNLAAELMGEDMAQYASGSGWFWYDYLYLVRTEYTSLEDRPYVWWAMYHAIISNCNYILKYAPGAEGDEDDRNSLLGQAYALRAYSYFYLAQFYQRTYKGHEDDPGIPIYTEPTDNKTKGVPRGTLRQTYKRITDDLNEAIRLLENATGQTHISHIDYYVANGIKARVALVMEEWETAENAALEALKKPSLKLMSTTDLLNGFSSKDNVEWMWGSEVIPDQATTWYSFFGHMDASAGYHAEMAQKCVGSWLYNMINDNDVRKSWFNGINTNPEPKPWEVDYCQQKFRDDSPSAEGDLVYMRAAEMYLILAEARCQRENYTGARQALSDVITYKYPTYETVLRSKTDSKNLTLKSTEKNQTVTLMDEIILQRRIELWGEGFRILDIKRLKTGFIRDYPGSNHTTNARFNITDPESWEWVMLIPQKEFDGNDSLDPRTDQNE
ncbi:MAG: RagB/SusD family nutrient uptake outer membrane protein [Bacteroidales bacterium]|nr:RagB/SusD family nutrient uptake outer membrane protein [Bacteroidales bacterium]